MPNRSMRRSSQRPECVAIASISEFRATLFTLRASMWCGHDANAPILRGVTCQGGTVGSRCGRGAALALGLVTVLSAAACTAKAQNASPPGLVGGPGPVSNTVTQTQQARAVQINIQPMALSAVNPANPIRVAAAAGKLATVKLTAAGGGSV